MIKVRTDQGEITISSAVFTTITGAAATNCFGVKGMAYRSMTDGLVHLLRREYCHGLPLHYERGQVCGHQKYRRGGPRGQCVRGLRYRVSCRSKEKRKDDR